MKSIAQTKYGFIVRSYANGTWCGWQPSDAIFATPVNTKPQNVHAVPGNGQVTLTWDAVENAEDYILQVAPIENLTGGTITF